MLKEGVKPTNPVVSVIVPCYNCASTIVSTLESLERQTFKLFEAILINDGSTDETEVVIKQHINGSRLDFKYISQENGGVSSARNRGLDVALGEYVVFLDADDIYHHDFIRILYSSIVESGVDVSFCTLTREPKKYWQDAIRLEASKISVISIMQQFMYLTTPLSFSTVMYVNKILRKNQIRFPVGLRYGEDQEFLWKYLTHIKSGVFINAPLYGYIDTLTSVMRNVNWHGTDAITASKNVSEYLMINESPFALEYNNYMPARTILHVQRRFASARRYDLFVRLTEEYDTKRIVKGLISFGKSKGVRLAALVYSFAPRLFYYAIGMLGKMNRFS